MPYLKTYVYKKRTRDGHDYNAIIRADISECIELMIDHIYWMTWARWMTWLRRDWRAPCSGSRGEREPSCRICCIWSIILEMPMIFLSDW